MEPSQENYSEGAERLIDWNEMVDGLDRDIADHIATMTEVTWDDLDDDVKAEIEAMRRKKWPFNQPHDGSMPADSAE